jgi:hypothetical protein
MSVPFRSQQVERVEEGLRLFPPAAQHVEPGQAALVATHHFAVDQAGADLEMVHGFHHEREAGGPVVTAPGQQPDAHGIAPGHQPVAVVLDFVNPN